MKKPIFVRAYKSGREFSRTLARGLDLMYSEDIKNIYEYLDNLEVFQLKANKLYKCKEVVSKRGSLLARMSYFLGNLSCPYDFLYVKYEEIRQHEEIRKEKVLENVMG